MSLFFLIIIFCFFCFFFGLLGADLSSLSRFLCLQAAAALSGCHVSSSELVVGISRRFAFQNKILSSTQNLWLQGRRPFKMKFFLRIHALNTSLILVLTSLNRLASLRVSLHFLHLRLPRWNSSTMKCLMFLKCFFKTGADEHELQNDKRHRGWWHWRWLFSSSWLP